MQRHGFSMIQMLALVAGAAVLMLAAYPIGSKMLAENRRAECQRNFKQIGIAFRQYVKDNGDTYPVSGPTKSSAGWAEALQVYLLATSVYQCPAEGNPPPATGTGPGYIDYFYNHKIGEVKGGLREVAFTNISNTVMGGEGTQGDAAYHRYSEEPRGNPPANQRHLEGSNFLFADGHVKWLKPGKIGHGFTWLYN